MRSFERDLMRQLSALIVPLTVQNFISAAISAADVLMVGHAGQSVLSAVSAAGQITFVLTLFYMGISGGLTILAAQYLGKGDGVSAERLLGIASVLSCAVSAVFFLASVAVPETLLGIFTGDAAIRALGGTYLRALAPSYLFMALSQMTPAVFRTTGRAALSTAISAVGLAVNTALNALCIFVLFPGDAEMTVIGVATATCTARAVELVWSLLALQRGDVRLRARNILRPDRLLLGDYVRSTAPMQLNYLVWGGGVAATAAIIGHTDSDLLAANAVVTTVRNLATVVCGGIGGGSVLVGQRLGRGDVEGARTAGYTLARLSVVFGVLAGVLVLLMRPGVSALTGLNARSDGFAGRMLLICAVYCMGKSFNGAVVGGVFCAGGDTTFGLVCDAITMWLVIVPAGLIAAFWLQLPPVGVYLVLSLDEFVKIPAVVRHFRREKWLRDLTR